MTRGTGRNDLFVLGAALVCFGLIAVTLELPAEEDAFIYYRYAWNWAHGRGLAFNPGDPVEGFSGPLWMGALALVAWCGLDLPSTAPALGIACGAATLVATWRLGGVIGLSTYGRRASLAALAMSLPFVVWSRSGLETPIYALAIVVAVAVYLAAEYPTDATPRARRWIGALSLIAVCLGRPEGLLLVAVVLGDRLVGRDWRGAVHYGLPVAMAYGVFLAWRVYTFHSLVPNTAVKLYTLLVGRSAGQALEYVLYLGVVPPAAAIFALLLSPGGAERRRLGVLLSAVLSSFSFHVLAGGDYRWAFRYLIPTLPLALVGAWYAFERLGSRPHGIRSVPSSSLARACFFALFVGGPAVWLIENPPRILDWRHRVFEPWRDPFSEDGHWGVQVARWVDEHVPPKGVVAFGQMGRVPYFVARRGHDVRFIDTLGLVDRDIAQIYRLDVKLQAFWRDFWNQRSLAGALETGRLDRAHRAAASILGRRPDFIIVEPALALLDARIKAMLESRELERSYREISSREHGGSLGVWIYASTSPP